MEVFRKIRIYMKSMNKWKGFDEFFKYFISPWLNKEQWF